MLVRIFGIYDSKAEAFLQPFFAKTKSEAIRVVTDAVNHGNDNFSKHPEDFTLFELAVFDDSDGLIVPNEVKQSLGCFIEFKREDNA